MMKKKKINKSIKNMRNEKEKSYIIAKKIGHR